MYWTEIKASAPKELVHDCGFTSNGFLNASLPNYTDKLRSQRRGSFFASFHYRSNLKLNSFELRRKTGFASKSLASDVDITLYSETESSDYTFFVGLQ